MEVSASRHTSLTQAGIGLDLAHRLQSTGLVLGDPYSSVDYAIYISEKFPQKFREKVFKCVEIYSTPQGCEFTGETSFLKLKGKRTVASETTVAKSLR